ncbi:hypothetical protein BASA81_004426 [Batrachochytrium salamandrivorans]|nr:hypothetical protein BASA81_004426 [Batrachochytrium salamandrivorans]
MVLLLEKGLTVGTTPSTHLMQQQPGDIIPPPPQAQGATPIQTVPIRGPVVNMSATIAPGEFRSKFPLIKSEEQETLFVHAVLQQRMKREVPIWLVAKEKRAAELYALLTHMIHETEKQHGQENRETSKTPLFQLGFRLVSTLEHLAPHYVRPKDPTPQPSGLGRPTASSYPVRPAYDPRLLNLDSAAMGVRPPPPPPPRGATGMARFVPPPPAAHLHAPAFVSPPLQPQPAKVPTAQATKVPTAQPTQVPTTQPTKAPTVQPIQAPTVQPTQVPIAQPDLKKPRVIDDDEVVDVEDDE